MDFSLEIFNAQLIAILDYDPSPANAIKVVSISMMTITDVESTTIPPTVVYLLPLSM